jgi:CheY-like chemotaxis protein
LLARTFHEANPLVIVVYEPEERANKQRSTIRERGEKTMKTILIVEDDADNGELYFQAIALETPHQPVLVPDGPAALNVIGEITPDLFLLDYHLPGMNGLELFDQLHAIEGLEHTPTILMSAGVLEHPINNRTLVGISKPVELEKLLDLIEDLLAG